MLSEEQKKQIEKEADMNFGEHALLLKFTDTEEHAKSFFEGKLWVNQIRKFIDDEKNTGNRGQGDRNEARYELRLFDLVFTDKETNKPIKLFDKATGYFQNKSDLDLPIFCMTGIKLKDFTKVWDGDKLLLKLPFSEEEYNTMEKTFGPFVTVLSDSCLISRLDEYSSKNNVPYIIDFIKYTESNDFEKARAHFQGDIQRVFYKDKFFEYQREVRVLFIMEMPTDHIVELNSFDTVNGGEYAVVTKSNQLRKFTIEAIPEGEIKD